MGEKTSLWSELDAKQWPGQVFNKKYESKIIAYNFSHFAELHIGSSIRYKYTLVGNYFLKSNKIKIIFISLNCFS